MVTDFEHKEMVDMFNGEMQEVVTTRTDLLNTVYKYNANSLISLPISIEKMREYQQGTVLIKQVIEVFERVFEAKQ